MLPSSKNRSVLNGTSILLSQTTAGDQAGGITITFQAGKNSWSENEGEGINKVDKSRLYRRN